MTAQATEKSVTFTNNGTQDGITVNGYCNARYNVFLFAMPILII